ncbi:MAG: phosphatidylinositol mannoside acyltransferase [Actinobacteria bacterium]|nr:phosphatidylinositol mannoside acyltransferase [Actinomycetota bacterium]MBO0785528.1 phosphatidylinositol mannoside acyltransferase [Actinomycetota bacterium]
MSRTKDWLADSGYALGWSLVCRMPESWARWLFERAADIAWRRQGHRVQVLEANLGRTGGGQLSGKQLRALSRRAMRSYARYWLEVFRLPVISTERIVADMRAIGEEQTALGHLKAGRGVVFALPHMGNWEHAGAWIIARGAGRFTTVAERLKPESVYERFVAFREGLGMEVLPATGGASRFGVLAQRLRGGNLVCLLADRDVTGSGIEVEFFGEKARMMAGPAALAVQTGAALMPVTLWYEGPYWGAHIHEEIPVPAAGSRREQVAAMTQQLARVFEQAINAHPEDWHMLQRVFVADLDPARLAAAVAAGKGMLNGEAVPGGAAGTGDAAGHGAGGTAGANGTAGTDGTGDPP